MTVTVRVENVEEAGTVILQDGAQPQVNIPVEAALSDPDRSVSQARDLDLAEGGFP